MLVLWISFRNLCYCVTRAKLSNQEHGLFPNNPARVVFSLASLEGSKGGKEGGREVGALLL